MDKRRHYALVGRSLGHSWSQRWFEAMFLRQGLSDCSYSLCEMPSLDGLRSWVADGHICGFNITVPYKVAILPLLDAMSDDARAIGAVNCVCVTPDGRLVGHNTDWRAFSESLQSCGAPLPSTALVLGSGGAARAVAYALGRLGVESRFVSRTPGSCPVPDAISYDEARRRAAAAPSLLLVNATPVGMWPDVDASPWPWPDDFSSRWTVYDLTYNPSPTLLMRHAAARGATVHDGLDMLQRQAALGWQLWQNPSAAAL